MLMGIQLYYVIYSTGIFTVHCIVSDNFGPEDDDDDELEPGNEFFELFINRQGRHLTAMGSDFGGPPRVIINNFYGDCYLNMNGKSHGHKPQRQVVEYNNNPYFNPYYQPPNDGESYPQPPFNGQPPLFNGQPPLFNGQPPLFNDQPPFNGQNLDLFRGFNSFLNRGFLPIPIIIQVQNKTEPSQSPPQPSI